MSSLEVTTGNIVDQQSGADNRLANGPSPAAPAKADMSKRSGKRDRAQAREASRPAKLGRPARAGSKQDLVIQMLRRQSGVTIEYIITKTGWQPHSVRGFLSGVVRKKLKLSLVSEIRKDGVRRYRITSNKSAKG